MRGLLPVAQPGIGESGGDTLDVLNISAKLNLILKIVADVEAQVKRLSEGSEITHTGERTTPSLYTEPKMEQSSPF